MLQKIINKLLILLCLFIILFILLPLSLGFELNSLKGEKQNLVYSKIINFEEITLEDQLLVRGKQGDIYIDSLSAINPMTQTLLLNKGDTVSEKAIVGKMVLNIPYLGNAYTTILAIEYDLKLQILVIIMVVYVTPEIIKTLLKKWRFHSQKMIQ